MFFIIILLIIIVLILLFGREGFWTILGGLFVGTIGLIALGILIIIVILLLMAAN